MGLSTLPYIVGAITTSEGDSFSGVLLAVDDTFQYYAAMQQGADGAWLFSLPYTAQGSDEAPILMLYLLAGKVAGWLGMSMPLMFHILRVTLGFSMLLMVYVYLQQVLSDDREIKLAYFLALFTGGFGIVFLILGAAGIILEDAALDLGLYDAYIYFAVMVLPHFSLTIFLMLALLMTGERFILTGDWWWGIIGMAVGAVLGFVHPHQLAVLGLILGRYSLLPILKDRQIAMGIIVRTGVLFVPAAIAAVMLLMSIRRDPFLTNWSEQALTLSPAIWTWLLAYGIKLPLAIVALWLLYRYPDEALLPLGIWLVVVAIAMYVPSNFQRRFSIGLAIPVSILASVAWYRAPFWDANHPSTHRIFFGSIIVMMISPFIVLMLGIGTALSEDTRITADMKNGMNYLASVTTEEQTPIVVSSYENGNRLPAYVPLRTVLGHWCMTAYIEERRQDVTQFFDAQTPEQERLAFLQSFGITHVYYGQKERELGAFDPSQSDVFTPVYESDTVTIYAVNLP